MSTTRIALYIGNELYPGPGSDPAATIRTLQQSPLTSPILSLVNQYAQNPAQIVYNDGPNVLFDSSGTYIGSGAWPGIISSLRSGGNIREVYLSFSTSGTQYMSNLISTNRPLGLQILSTIKGYLGFDGIDLDYEDSNLGSGSPIYVVAEAAVAAGLKLTAAPYRQLSDWQAWVQSVQRQGGTVSWLNLQCYAGGKSNNPGDWLGIGVPIVAGSCNQCGYPTTTCSPSDMESLFRLWTKGQGSVSRACWSGTPNTKPQAIGGGFIWVYSSIKDNFSAYMAALQRGLGL